MYKRFLILILLFIPSIVNASLIKDLEVLNGTLSRDFQSTNNYYSVDLNEGSDTLLLNYTLEEGSIANIKYEEDKAILTISKDNITEDYVFYLNKNEEEIPVFNENIEETKIIPHLKEYISIGCIIIIILFKILVLGFKKHK